MLTVAVQARARVALLAACAALAACKSKDAEDPGGDPTFSVNDLLRPAAIAEGLIAKGGAKVETKTVLHVAPTGPKKEGVLGDQDVTTQGMVQLDARGHYALAEENDQDGGREIYFTGDEIAVKLRYGKLTKRNARAPEPERLLEQALGGPAAFWQIFSRAAVIRDSSGPAPGEHTVSVSLGQVNVEDEPPAPSASTPAALSVWRRTAQPTALTGTITYLARTDKTAAVVVRAHLVGAFTARAAGGPVEGKMEVTLSARDFGQVPSIVMPEDAADLRLGQRTILEERALLDGLPSVKTSPPRQ